MMNRLGFCRMEDESSDERSTSELPWLKSSSDILSATSCSPVTLNDYNTSADQPGECAVDTKEGSLQAPAGEEEPIILFSSNSGGKWPNN